MAGLPINGAPDLAEHVRSFEGSSICSFVFLVLFKYILYALSYILTGFAGKPLSHLTRD